MNENKRLIKYIRYFAFLVAFILSISFITIYKSNNKVKADNSQQYLNNADYQITLNVITEYKYQIKYYLNITDFNQIKNLAEPGTGLLKFGYQFTINGGEKTTIYIDYYSFNLDLFSTEPQTTTDNFYTWSIEKTLPNSENNLKNSYFQFNAYLYEDATGRFGQGSGYSETINNLEYIQNQYQVGYNLGYRDGKQYGMQLSTGEAYEEGALHGDKVGYDRGYEKGYKKAKEDFENDLTAWIWAYLGGIQGFLDIKIGVVSIGAILLIPFGISFAWFIIKQFKGGGN